MTHSASRLTSPKTARPLLQSAAKEGFAMRMFYAALFLAAVWLCFAAAGGKVHAQSGEIIVLREVSPRIATRPASQVQETGPVRVKVFAGPDHIVQSGVTAMGESLLPLQDASLGNAVSGTALEPLGGFSHAILQPLLGAIAYMQTMPAASFGGAGLAGTQGGLAALPTQLPANTLGATGRIAPTIQMPLQGLTSGALSSVMVPK
jgi:hypothetical protein